ncbi:Protein IQ-DOMAIN 29 [Cardamine amara subsp. amara]|uniref:Protein IQ-DOMAIN 29 n=1 Tax=Cardamine amara subsp. amara TaxID=228776 RepID=A0ABD1C857_CARAN
MGKTPSPGKWIKSLLGKKSSKSSLEKGSEKLRSAKKEEIVVKVKDKDNNVSNLPVDSPVVSSQEVAATQTVVVPDVVITEKQPSGDIEGDLSNVNLESGNDSEEVKLEEAATKAREEFETLKGNIRLQAVIRGHLVRRQAVATYSCIWGIVKLQAVVRGKQARSSETGAQFQKTNTETENSEALQGSSTCSWMENPTKLSMIDKLLVSSPTALPLKIQYSPEDPNSAKVWLERWTQLQVWAPGPLVVKSVIPKSQTKKRSFHAVEADKGKPKRGIKKPIGGSNTGNSSSSEKPKRTVRKASTLGKELSRVENGDKSKQSSRKSTSAIKQGSSLEVKDEKPRISLKKSSLSNGTEKPTRKSAEKKKETADSVQKELPVEEVSASVVDASEDEKTKVIPEAVSKESDLDKDEKSPVLDNSEEEKLKTADKAEEEIQEPDMQISSENGNVASENTKPSDRRASLPAMIENHHQDDGLTQSGRKIPSYMAPTASAKARIRGQGSPRIALEKPEKNGTTRRHSLPPAANGKLNTMSPRAHRLLIASAKGSINSDRSFSSSKDIGDKSTKAEWKR